MFTLQSSTKQRMEPHIPDAGQLHEASIVNINYKQEEPEDGVDLIDFANSRNTEGFNEISQPGHCEQKPVSGDSPAQRRDVDRVRISSVMRAMTDRDLLPPIRFARRTHPEWSKTFWRERASTPSLNFAFSANFDDGIIALLGVSFEKGSHKSKL
mmetsp:Transcript_59/g.117  ORF Transcript_59/g.117 Transcript_59/m.117 type:complete len:155 (-) Transcript_59:443-907(-)